MRRAVEALRNVARMEAGLSKAPDLIRTTDTQAWKDATTLDKWLKGKS